MSALSTPSSTSLTWSEHPGRALVRLAWPITVSMVSFSMMTLASTAFVAHIGADELAGVGLAGVVGFALVCFGIGLLRGAKTLVSQAVGAGRRDRLPELFGAALALAAVLGVAALRETSYGVGNATAPMRASLAANAVNIALDATLILGLHWGVRGAAVATICGNVTELSMLAWAFYGSKRPVEGSVTRGRKRVLAVAWSRRAVRDVWAQGVANGVQFIMEVGSFLILTVLVARMSAIDGAAHQMVLHLVNVSFLPAHALAEAAAVLVGQAVGAGRDALVPRVAKRALALGAGYASVCLVGYAILGSSIASAMSAGDHALAARATMLVHVSLAFLVADAANVIARGVLRGASDVRYAAVVGIATSWVTTPPLTYLLGMRWGLGAVGGWIGLAIEIVVGASLFWLRVARSGWQPAAASARRAMAGTAV